MMKDALTKHEGRSNTPKITTLQTCSGEIIKKGDRKKKKAKGKKKLWAKSRRVIIQYGGTSGEGRREQLLRDRRKGMKGDVFFFKTARESIYYKTVR